LLEDDSPGSVVEAQAAVLGRDVTLPEDVGAPTLVIHGAEDPLVDVSGGRATAEAIPGAKLVVIDGMGHDLPRDLWPVFIDNIVELVRSVE
jgi:pimeloyl-ACP methyl ester carboxylesterase